MVTMDQIDGPDLLDQAFRKHGLTMEDYAASVAKRIRLIENTFKRRKKVSNKDVPLLNAWRKDNELVRDTLRFKKPDQVEVDHSGSLVLELRKRFASMNKKNGKSS